MTHIRLPPNSTRKCWALQANIWTLCNAKVGIGKHDTSAPTYKKMKKNFLPPTIWSMGFGFAMTTSSFVWVATRWIFMDQSIVPKIWPLTINISREEVLSLEYIMFQLQQREALLPHYRLSIIGTLPIPLLYFRMRLNHDAHPTSKIVKIVLTPTTLTINRKNKLESDILMDEYYIVEVTAIPYLGSGVIIIIIFKEDTPTMSQVVAFHNEHTCTSSICLSWLWERKGNRCIANNCTMNLYFYPRWMTTMWSSSMLQHIPATRTCDYLRLSVLLNTSIDSSIVFIVMY